MPGKRRRSDNSSRSYPYRLFSNKYREYADNMYPRGSPESIGEWGSSYRNASMIQRKRRLAARFKGEGDYRQLRRGAKWGLRGAGALAGAAMGGMSGGLVGAARGGVSGWKKGAQFSKFVGLGDYDNVGSSNQIVSGGSRVGGQQQISVNPYNDSGDIFISHSEFIQNISCSATAAGASAFQLQAFPINAAMQTTFPFLSQIAQNYVLYEFEGVIFQFKPTSGESSSASNSLGKVIMATQYDPDAAAFINSIQMENYDYANSMKPSIGGIHGVETETQQGATNMLYTRTGTSSKSKVFTDVGTFYVATEGIPFSAAGTQIIGELWVSYKVRLSRANLYGAYLGNNITQDVFTSTTSTNLTMVGTMVAKSSNRLGSSITADATTPATLCNVLFPVNITYGCYLVYMNIQSSDATPLTTQNLSLPTNLANCTVFWAGRSIPTGTPGTGSIRRAPLSMSGTTSNSEISICFMVSVAAPGSLQAGFTLGLSAALVAAKAYQTSFLITQVDSNISLAIA